MRIILRTTPPQLVLLMFTLATLPVMSLTGCAQEKLPGPVAMDAAETERWEIALVEWRIEKNEVFMDTARTPLPEAMLVGFEGLDYYYPEAGFRYRVALLPTEGAPEVMLTRKRGDEVAYTARGRVRFQHGGKACELTVFAPSAGGGPLWLPFYDPTNGESTFAGGRYLDLELAADGTVEIDFNKAYNPLCAYDAERYNCVLPPAANTMPVAVVAGEKLLGGALP